jgi:predicted transcriptional regulator
MVRDGNGIKRDANRGMQFPPLSSVAKRRKALGKTQAELAKLCEIGQSFVAKIERGEAMPSYAVAVKLFETLERLESKHSERLSDLHAGDAMTKRVITVTPSDGMDHARKIMLEKNISQLPVLDAQSGAPVGCITERTMLEMDNDAFNRKVKDLMDKKIFPTVARNATLSLVISILREQEEAVLVMDEGKIVGIITKYDVLSSKTKKS